MEDANNDAKDANDGAGVVDAIVVDVVDGRSVAAVAAAAAAVAAAAAAVRERCAPGRQIVSRDRRLGGLASEPGPLASGSAGQYSPAQKVRASLATLRR